MRFLVPKPLAIAATLIVALAVARSEPLNSLKAAVDALGTNQIETLSFVASGDSFTVGQNFAPTDPWPRVPVRNYTVLINYRTASMRVDMLREMGTTMPRGGGVPFTGRLHQIQVLFQTTATHPTRDHSLRVTGSK